MIQNFKASISDMKTLRAISSAFRKVFLYPVLLLIVCTSSSFAESGVDQMLSPYREQVGKLIEKRDCSGIFTLLWPKAKSGDSAARLNLFLLLVPMIDMDGITMPGHEDYISRMRDGIIMLVHGSNGEFFSKKIFDFEKENNYIKMVFSWQGLDDQPYAEKFLKCISSGPNKNCAIQAVNDGLVPSFETYAKEIDALSAQGVEPVCYFRPDDALDISGTGK